MPSKVQNTFNARLKNSTSAKKLSLINQQAHRMGLEVNGVTPNGYLRVKKRPQSAKRAGSNTSGNKFAHMSGTNSFKNVGFQPQASGVSATSPRTNTFVGDASFIDNEKKAEQVLQIYSSSLSKQGGKQSHWQCHDKSVHPNRSKSILSKKMKQIIPNLQGVSKEYLYEEAIRVKMDFNSIKDENKRLQTRLQILENQLGNKEMMFVDICQTAFKPQYAPENSMVGNHNPKSITIAPGSSLTLTGSSKSGKGQRPGSSYVRQNNSQLHSTSATMSASHASQHQVIIGLKRSIRELRAVVESKDCEIESLKRNVKATQINQLLIELETFRQECVRLRAMCEDKVVQQLDSEREELVQLRQHLTHQFGLEKDQMQGQFNELKALKENSEKVLSENLNSLQKQKEECDQVNQQRIQQLESDLAEKEDQVEHLLQDLDKLQGDHDRLTEDKKQADSQIKEFEDHQDKLKSLHEDLQTQFTDLRATSTQQQSKIGDLEARIAQLEEQIEELESQIKGLQQIEQSLDQTIKERDSQISSLEQQAQQHQTDIETLTKERDDLNNKLSQLENEKCELQQTVDELQDESSALKQKLESKEQDFADFKNKVDPELPEKYRNMCDENTNLSGQLTHLKSQIGSLGAEKQSLTDLLEIKKQEILGLKIEIDQMQYHYAMAKASDASMKGQSVREAKTTGAARMVPDTSSRASQEGCYLDVQESRRSAGETTFERDESASSYEMNERDESSVEEKKPMYQQIDTDVTVERIDNKKYMADTGQNLNNFLDGPTTGNVTESIDQIRRSSEDATESWNQREETSVAEAIKEHESQVFVQEQQSIEIIPKEVKKEVFSMRNSTGPVTQPGVLLSVEQQPLSAVGPSEAISSVKPGDFSNYDDPMSSDQNKNDKTKYEEWDSDDDVQSDSDFEQDDIVLQVQIKNTDDNLYSIKYYENGANEYSEIIQSDLKTYYLEVRRYPKLDVLAHRLPTHQDPDFKGLIDFEVIEKDTKESLGKGVWNYGHSQYHQTFCSMETIQIIKDDSKKNLCLEVMWVSRHKAGLPPVQKKQEIKLLNEPTSIEVSQRPEVKSQDLPELVQNFDSESEQATEVSSIQESIETAVLYVTIKKAVILKNCDSKNLNDPYVLIKFTHKAQNKLVSRTTTFKMNSNQPEWEERFICHVPTMDSLGMWGDRLVPLKAENYHHFIQVELWDKDFKKQDDLIGRGILDYGKIKLSKGKYKIKWIKMEDNNETTGHVQIRFGWAQPLIGLNQALSLKNEAIQEGFQRIRLACQIKLLKFDEIENFLFGKDYRPEAKLSVAELKQVLIIKLGMWRYSHLQLSATIFAVFLVDQSAEIQVSPRDQQVLDIDESQKVLACRIITSLLSNLSKFKGGLQYYSSEKEEKMKLIVGEKIQDQTQKAKLTDRLTCEDPTLSFKQFEKCFQDTGINLSVETLECAFIHLVKLSKPLEIDIKKEVFLDFIVDCSTQAYNLTMTGNKFPVEAELLEYSSDSEFGHDRESREPTGRDSQRRSRGNSNQIGDPAQLLSVPRSQESENPGAKFEEEEVRKSIEDSIKKGSLDEVHSSINHSLGQRKPVEKENTSPLIVRKSIEDPQEMILSDQLGERDSHQGTDDKPFVLGKDSDSDQQHRKRYSQEGHSEEASIEDDYDF